MKARWPTCHSGRSISRETLSRCAVPAAVPEGIARPGAKTNRLTRRLRQAADRPVRRLLLGQPARHVAGQREEVARVQARQRGSGVGRRPVKRDEQRHVAAHRAQAPRDLKGDDRARREAGDDQRARRLEPVDRRHVLRGQGLDGPDMRRAHPRAGDLQAVEALLRPERAREPVKALDVAGDGMDAEERRAGTVAAPEGHDGPSAVAHQPKKAGRLARVSVRCGHGGLRATGHLRVFGRRRHFWLGS